MSYHKSPAAKRQNLEILRFHKLRGRSIKGPKELNPAVVCFCIHIELYCVLCERETFMSLLFINDRFYNLVNEFINQFIILSISFIYMRCHCCDSDAVSSRVADNRCRGRDK